MSRAMEMLKYSWPEFSQSQLTPYLRWVDATLMPLMDFYVDVITPTALGNGRRNLYGNWHASVADCFMAHGVLADSRARYAKGVDLYRKTVGEYFKWGRGADAGGRIVGEATETLRDIYHTQFGLGSLLQAAETAWAQGADEYRANNYAMAAAMELHARIINARDADDETMLPPGFRFFDSMPDAPANCSWRFDIEAQSWSSFNQATGEKCGDLDDGLKYVVGIKHLATGWELGYNHYVGRLGMAMPETAAMLARYPVDWVEFSCERLRPGRGFWARRGLGAPGLGGHAGRRGRGEGWGLASDPRCARPGPVKPVQTPASPGARPRVQLSLGRPPTALNRLFAPSQPRAQGAARRLRMPTRPRSCGGRGSSTTSCAAAAAVTTASRATPLPLERRRNARARRARSRRIRLAAAAANSGLDAARGSSGLPVPCGRDKSVPWPAGKTTTLLPVGHRPTRGLPATVPRPAHRQPHPWPPVLGGRDRVRAVQLPSFLSALGAQPRTSCWGPGQPPPSAFLWRRGPAARGRARIIPAAKKGAARPPLRHAATELPQSLVS
jgi:hypothetical protein